MKELLLEWSNNNLARHVVVSERIGLLRSYKGYRSNIENVFNITLDQIIINPSHKKLETNTLSKILNDYKPEYSKSYCEQKVQSELIGSLPKRRDRTFIPPFTANTFKEVLDSDNPKSLKIEKISEQVHRFFEGKGGFQFTSLTPNKLKQCFDYVVDWNETFGDLSSVEIVQWLVAIKMGTFFNLPTDFRGLKNNNWAYTQDKLKKHPLFKLLVRLRFIEGVNAPNFSLLVDEYTNALLNGTDKTRSPFCFIIQSLEKAIASLLQALAQDGVIYLPYSIPSLALDLRLMNTQLPWHTPLGEVCASLIEDGNKHKNEIVLFLRNVSRSSNLETCDDIPLEYPSDLTSILKNYQNSKGYSTATGFPFIALKQIIDRYELNFPEGERFNRAFLENITARRMKSSDQRRSSFELNHATDVIGDNLLMVMRDFLTKEGTKHKLNSINVFIDWLREISSSDFKYDDINEFVNTMFYDPMGKQVVKLTLRQFILDKGNSENQNYTQWSGVNSFFDFWVSSLSLNTGKNINNPVSKPDVVFPILNTHRGITVREAMPSILHEKCVEVLTENNYEICAETLVSQCQIEVTNFQTGNKEVINNNTVARCLHLLLLLPVRGKQARWLDEGLLDDRIWDLNRQCFVKNTHPLAEFKYPNGKSHCRLHGKTGVFNNNQNSGNDSLKLHISTNKTQSYRLLEQGKLGYDIPWPYGTGIAQIDDVWSILSEQKCFNDIYMNRDIQPIRLDDEEPDLYKQHIREKLPYFVPLFREIEPQVSRADPRNRFNLAYPISRDNITKLFKAVLLRAEHRYKEEYPQFKEQSIVRTEDGEWMYDVHSLRVYGVTELIEKGMPVEVVQMIVGHATSIMTGYYYKLSLEKLKSLLIKAKKMQGISIEHQKEMYSDSNDQLLIAMFDLMEETSELTSDKSRAKVAPNFSGGGIDKNVKGGICSSFDCDSGGIKIIVHKNGTAAEVTSTLGGKFRCGNCRYWRSGPRFILEQIYEINIVAEEIRELRDERNALIEKSHAVRDDNSIENRNIIAEQFDRKVDQKGEVLACRVIELGRRQSMLEASLQKANVSGFSGNKMVLKELARQNIECSPPKWEKVSKFNACRELQSQAAVLGLPIEDNEVSMRKIEKFVSQALSVAGESQNPFIFMPDNEVKRVALLYAIANSCEKLGRDFSDEEFENPRLLIETLGLKDMKALVAGPLSLGSVNDLLEN